MSWFQRTKTLKEFAAVHASVTNDSNQERIFSRLGAFMTNRAVALTEWRGLGAFGGQST